MSGDSSDLSRDHAEAMLEQAVAAQTGPRSSMRKLSRAERAEYFARGCGFLRLTFADRAYIEIPFHAGYLRKDALENDEEWWSCVRACIQDAVNHSDFEEKT